MTVVGSALHARAVPSAVGPRKAEMTAPFNASIRFPPGTPIPPPPKLLYAAYWEYQEQDGTTGRVSCHHLHTSDTTAKHCGEMVQKQLAFLRAEETTKVPEDALVARWLFRMASVTYVGVCEEPV